MGSLDLSFEERIITRTIRSDTDFPKVLEFLRQSSHEELSTLCPTTNASLLFYAVQRPNDKEALALCKLLCDEFKTCDPTQPDKNQQTALFFAARDGNASCVKYLITKGCRPDHRDSAMQTALFYAARDGRLVVVEALLDSGADINCADHLGQTALFYGARDGRTETVAIMLKKGANIHVRDRHRRTALYYAMRNNHRDLVTLLKAAEASLNSKHPGLASISPALAETSKLGIQLSLGDNGATEAGSGSPTGPKPAKRVCLGTPSEVLSQNGHSTPALESSPAPILNSSPPAATALPTASGATPPKPLRRRCYRLAIRSPFCENTLNEERVPHLLWLSAPTLQIQVFESLFPTLAVWPRDAPTFVTDIFTDLRLHWQPLALSVLDELSHAEGGWVFLKPVDCKAWGCPDYYDVIQYPMDFATMRKKLKAQSYPRCADFLADMELIFSNCFRYNRPESHVAAIGRTIQELFRTLWTEKGLQKWIDREQTLEKWYAEQNTQIFDNTKVKPPPPLPSTTSEDEGIRKPAPAETEPSLSPSQTPTEPRALADSNAPLLSVPISAQKQRRLSNAASSPRQPLSTSPRIRTAGSTPSATAILSPSMEPSPESSTTAPPSEAAVGC